MNDEIKEILDNLKDILDEPKGLDEMPNGNLYEYDRSYDLEQDEIKLLYDYITNLQQENERLKQPQIFIDTQDMEERYGEELYQDYLKEQLDDYKSRCEKASEILHNLNDTLPLDLILSEIEHSESILQNGSDEE